MSPDLERFVEAQNPLWQDVQDELRGGEKLSHWMWFVFPQIAGLGSSEMAVAYAIADAAEARGYLAHPVLNQRLRAAAGLLLEHTDRTAEAMLGPVDAAKLQSCATLFGHVADDAAVFTSLLGRFFDGREDERTLALLKA